MSAAELLKVILLEGCACIVAVLLWEEWPHLRRPWPPDEVARKRRRRAQRKDAQ